jgi:hypothetical protein
MIYLVYEQELKLYVASSVDSLSKQKGSDATKSSYEGLFILYFEFESYEHRTIKRDKKCIFQESNRCSSCQKTYERHLCTNTFTGLTFWVLTLGGRSFRVFPGVSRLPGVFEVFPDIPGLRVVTSLFWVRGYKSLLRPFLSLSLSCPFRCTTTQNSFTPLFTPIGLVMVRFVGDLRRV